MVNKKAAGPTPDLDELLSKDDSTKVEEATTDAKVEEKKSSPEQEEIARLRAEIAAEENKAVTNPTVDGKPKAEAELTPEQREIRILQDQLAKKRADNFSKSTDVYGEVEEDAILIHFVEDGFTAQGRTWYTGQTVAFGASAYEQTKDRYGNSWLDYTDSQQYRAYGKVFFRRGAWEGATYEDDVAAEDRSRGTAAPIVTI